ncbi:MAG: hypothetical protein V1843_03425 [bacterium]
MMFFGGLIFWWLLFTVLVCVWASNLGRSAILAFLVCVFLGPIFPAIYFLIVGSAYKCPYCKGGIPKGITRCRHCGSAV